MIQPLDLAGADATTSKLTSGASFVRSGSISPVSYTRPSSKGPDAKRHCSSNAWLGNGKDVPVTPGNSSSDAGVGPVELIEKMPRSTEILMVESDGVNSATEKMSRLTALSVSSYRRKRKYAEMNDESLNASLDSSLDLRPRRVDALVQISPDSDVVHIYKPPIDADKKNMLQDFVDRMRAEKATNGETISAATSDIHHRIPLDECNSNLPAITNQLTQSADGRDKGKESAPRTRLKEVCSSEHVGLRRSQRYRRPPLQTASQNYKGDSISSAPRRRHRAPQTPEDFAAQQLAVLTKANTKHNKAEAAKDKKHYEQQPEDGGNIFQRVTTLKKVLWKEPLIPSAEPNIPNISDAGVPTTIVVATTSGRQLRSRG